jgi:hypothetical protein
MNQEKVLFPFEGGAEAMWADVLGGGRYVLDNVPVFAYDISYADEFSANRLPDGRLLFDRIHRRGGHSTYRVTLQEGLSADTCVLDRIAEAKRLSALTSDYAGELIAFSVRDRACDAGIERLLEDGKSHGLWDWEISSARDDVLS